MEAKDMGFIVVGLLIVLPGLMVYLRRKATDWGVEKGKEFAANQAAKNLGSTLEGFGQPVRFPVSSALSLPVLEQTIGSKKQYVRGSGFEWTKLFLGEEQFKVALVDTADGSELRVVAFVERGGVYPGGPEWQLLKLNVLKAASKLGVAATVDAVTSTYDRGERIDERTVVWRAQ